MSSLETVALVSDLYISNSANQRPRPITLIGYQGLKARGIAYSRSHLWRLEAARRFPRRVHVGKGRVAWVQHEVDDYLSGLAAARDAGGSPSVEVASGTVTHRGPAIALGGLRTEGRVMACTEKGQGRDPVRQSGCATPKWRAP